MTTVRFFALAAVSALTAWSGTTVCNNSGPQIAYQFVGQCSDCTGTGVGRLVLQNYTPGASLTFCNFVSLVYSSNLTSFTITQSNLSLIVGTLPASPAAATVSILGTDDVDVLVSNTLGLWFAGNPPNDFGSSSTWSLVASVPALSVPAMFGLASMLVILGVILLKRFPNRRFV